MFRSKALFKTIVWIFFLTISLNLLIISFQIIVQFVQQAFYISIGFPLHFFYFNVPLGLRGSNMIYFLIDGAITICLVIVGINLVKRINKRNSGKTNANLLDLNE